MTNPSHFFRSQGHLTKIINDTIVDDTKWNLFSDNGKKFNGRLSILDKKHKFRDINLQDVSKIIENQTRNSIQQKKKKYTKREKNTRKNRTNNKANNKGIRKTKRGKNGKTKRKRRKIGQN